VASPGSGCQNDGSTVAILCEAEAVERARRDPEAFGELYRAHYDTILNYLYRRTLNQSLAEELTSNTFFKALRALPSYRNRAPFRAWLYRIASNELRSHFRSQRHSQGGLRTVPWEEGLERVYFTQSEVVERAEREARLSQYARLQAVLARLPDRYQAVLVLRYFERLEYREIAQVMGKRLGTVKSLLHRGLKRMRSLLDEENAT